MFPEPIHRLLVDVELIADMTPINPFDYFLEPDAEAVPFSYDEALRSDLAPYLEVTERGEAAQEAGQVRRRLDRGRPTTSSSRSTSWSRASSTTRSASNPASRRSEETLIRRSGSCRDSAWLLVQLLRHLGYAARFVSGYLVQLIADEAPLEGPGGPTADFTDLHAWAEVYLPGAGWVGLDPTSGLFAGEGHIPLAATPHPPAAAPITGATDPCEVEFEFSNTVSRIYETPRVHDALHRRAVAARSISLGHRVDAALDAARRAAHRGR